MFLTLSRVYNANKFTTAYFPYLYAILSYYSHAGFIFRGYYDDPTDSSQVHMTKDILFRHIVQFAALGMNLIFMGIFLVITRRDCIMLNIFMWSLYMFDVFQQEGKFYKNLLSILNHWLGLTRDTYIASILLSAFTIKFTLDAQQIKDQIFELYYRKD